MYSKIVFYNSQRWVLRAWITKCGPNFVLYVPQRGFLRVWNKRLYPKFNVLQFPTVNSTSTNNKMWPKHLLFMHVEIIVVRNAKCPRKRCILRSPISFMWYFCSIPNHCVLKKIMFPEKDFNSWYAFKRLRALTNKWLGTSERKWE